MQNYLGNPENYDPDKVNVLRGQKRIRGIANLEKAIFSLEYVAQVKDHGLDFVFKGGSAVQILLGDEWNRLSVDADICANTTKEELLEILGSINMKFGGDYYSFTERNTSVAGPFVSYRIRTPIITDIQRSILLDVQLVTPNYTTQETKLESFFFKSDISVKTPTIASILGDKLSVIGPNTSGRTLDSSQNGLEYAKHFYDINSLTKLPTKFNETKETYLDIVKKQSKIREEEFQYEDCIADALFTCNIASLPQGYGSALISSSTIEKERGISEFENLQSGLTEFRPFLVNEMIYTWDELRKFASNTTLLLEQIRRNITAEQADKIQRINPVVDEGIEYVTKKIQAVDEKDRWFIDLEEIQAFPEVLNSLYKTFYFDELIG